VQVCRVSGKLPNAGCSHVEVINDAGEVSERSMIVTDYFARGAAPIEMCPLHPGESMMARVGGFFGNDHKETPESASSLGLPNAPASAPVVPAVAGEPTPPPVVQEEQPKKKRGFWAKIFGKKDKTDERKTDPPKPK